MYNTYLVVSVHIQVMVKSHFYLQNIFRGF